MRRGCHPLTAYEAMHALHSDETLRNHFLFYGAHRVIVFLPNRQLTQLCCPQALIDSLLPDIKAKQ
jgi:hypothetical protein